MTGVLPGQTRRTVRAIVADRLRERGAFLDTSGWLASLYDRMLLRRPKRSMPFRRRVVHLCIAGTATPVAVRLGTSDLRTANEMFVRCDYARVTACAAEPVRTVVDLGANIGLSVRLWQEAFPDARIVAVEPDSENMAMCRRNVALVPRPDVVFLEVAVGGRSRLVELDRSREEWSFRTREHNVDQPSTAVRAMTVPDIFSEGGVDGTVDLLKCDVEGAEAEIFADCRSWLPRVRRMVVEVHAPYTGERLAEDLRRNEGQFAGTTLRRQRNAQVLLFESVTSQSA